MASLQPWMWWALPAVLLPLLIHLLNRLRYQTVPWAATLFLLKANRAATKRAKIRQYLLLACRMLAIFFLIWAMSRPLVGGWLGAAAGGAPEVVLLLLDRSASMEARLAGQTETRREHALALLRQAARQSAGSRFVLVESTGQEPLEIADASRLAALPMTGPSDTAADLPKMFRTALEYLLRNRPGSAEIWAASDLQASNWRPDSPEWQELASRFAALPAPAPVRLLDFSSPLTSNASIAVTAAELRPTQRGEAAELALHLEVKTLGATAHSLPLVISLGGVRSQKDLAVTGSLQRQTLKFPLPKMAAGWGKVEIPADELSADNTAFFAYGPPPTARTVVFGEGEASALLRLAAAPDPSDSARVASQLAPGNVEAAPWGEMALAIWAAAGAPPSDTKLRQWVEAGGVLICFPADGEAAGGPLGLAWNPAEQAAAGGSFRVASWEDLDGPLARTENGASLPVARLEVTRRSVPTLPTPAHVDASFSDGRPFLLSRRLGAGRIYACAVRPERAWGNLGEGPVLLPLVQRLTREGSGRLAPPRMAIVGMWQPPSGDEPWVSVDREHPGDWRWRAGVYQQGVQTVALNRPAAEDLPESLPAARLSELLHGSKVTVLTGAAALKPDALQSEIWPLMLGAVMLLMCLEMLLATSRPAAERVSPGQLPSRQPAGVA